MTHRDANQGACTNSCRWKYQAHEAKENEVGELIPVKTVDHWEGQAEPQEELPEEKEPLVALLQEKGRPGELMPAYEDEHGTYIMNSKDLRAVQHVKTLSDMGVQSLKIEGRTKSHYYVARTAQVYRRAIDEAAAGKEFTLDMMDELEALSNRGYTEGFYRRHRPAEYQNYETGNSLARQQQFVGEVIGVENDQLLIDVKNRFEAGQKVELMMPGGNHYFTLESIEDKHGKATDSAPGSGHQVKIPLPEGYQADDKNNFGLLVKYLDQPIST
jgi:putative protease